jgi:filamentous hemagglutinin
MRGDGNFASATQQSGFLAGDGGFGVKVTGNTNLVGGVISSTGRAVDEGKNSFSSGSLTMTDLVNHDIFRGSGHSINLSTSGSPSAGIGSSDINRSSTTQSGISGIAGNASVRTGVGSANALRQTEFDRAMRDVGAQVQLTAQFGGQAARAAGSYADQKFQEALNNNDPEGQRLWGADGAYRTALHAGIGALTGGPAERLVQSGLL